jgi:hypothetical protein
VTLASSACAGPTANLKPHVEQRHEVEVERVAQPKTTTQDAKPGTAGPTARDAVHACERYKSLATPEAAVNLYIESIAANDFACALRAYAAHEQAARFDFTALVRYVHMWSPASLKAPAGYPMFVEMNELQAKAEMAQATKLFVYGLLSDRELMRTYNAESDAQIQAFIQAVDPARLATLRVVRIDQPRQSASNSPKAQELFKEFATRAGADEMTERIALYELSGRFFRSGFQLTRYDQRWTIYTLNSNYVDPVFVAKTTPAEYAALLQ